MKVGFAILCFLNGFPSGTNQVFFSNMHNCLYFSEFLSKQKSVKIGDEDKQFSCYCKMVMVNKKVRLY